jgi:DNA-binding response OmpR family regulator
MDIEEPRRGNVLPLHPSRAMGNEHLLALLAEPSLWAVRAPDFEIDLLDHCVRFPDGEEVRFTPRQWQLLDFLVRAPGRRHTAAVLARELFGDDAQDEAHQIPVLVHQLRRKLEPDLRAPRYMRCLDAETYLFDPRGGAQVPPLGGADLRPSRENKR